MSISVVSTGERMVNKMLTEEEVLRIVIAAGGQICVKEEHVIEASQRSLVIRECDETKEVLLTSIPRNQYGICAHCSGRVVSRERRIDGNDKCVNGHVYPSRLSRL